MAAGLAGDAAVHVDLAGQYGGGELLSIENLFLGASGLAALAGVLVLVVPRAWTVIVALAVAAGTLAAVVTARYVDVGAPSAPSRTCTSPSGTPQGRQCRRRGRGRARRRRAARPAPVAAPLTQR